MRSDRKIQVGSRQILESTIIKQINRQLREHETRLGTESGEYEQLRTRLYSLLGAPTQNRSGQLIYSRSEAKAYLPDALARAYQAVTGRGTAAAQEQKYIKRLLDMKVKPTRRNVQRVAKLERIAGENRSALYELAKEMSESKDPAKARLGAELRQLFRDNSTDPGASEFDLLHRIARTIQANDPTSNQDILDLMYDLITQAQSKSASQRSAKAQSARSKTKGGGIVI